MAARQRTRTCGRKNLAKQKAPMRRNTALWFQMIVLAMFSAETSATEAPATATMEPFSLANSSTVVLPDTRSLESMAL